MPPQEQISSTTTRNIWTGVVIVVALLLLAWWYVASGGFSFGNSKMDPNAFRAQFIENVQKNANGISGQIQHVDVQGGTQKLEVKTEVLDIASSTGSTSASTPLLGTISKTITVLVDGKTAITGTSDFKVGDTVNVLLDKSVYQGIDFHAVKISIYNRIEEIKNQAFTLNLIHGNIEKITSNSLLLKTQVPDKTKKSTLNFSGAFTVPYIDKEYTILIDNNTQFVGGGRSGLKVGVSVSIWGNGDLLNTSSFTATKILYEQ
ncbi:MAG: DUF5666 domain-containing protein [Minisyncoccota bacterium]